MLMFCGRSILGSIRVFGIFFVLSIFSRLFFMSLFVIEFIRIIYLVRLKLYSFSVRFIVERVFFLR